LHLEPLEDRCLLSGYTTGPLALLSSPDPLPNAPPGVAGTNVAVEPYVAVNPSNPNNIAAVWTDHPFSANVASVTFDGGATWQNVPIPVSQYEGGPYSGAADAWASFGPNGDLYASSVSVPVNKSTDGGLTWGQPIQVVADQDKSRTDDKPSITADPTNPNYVYATWARSARQGNENSASTMFARSTDGGKTWEPDRDIHDAPNNDFNYGHQIVVLPDGTLIDAFCEGDFNGNRQATLTLLRSTDHGQTWSAPISAVAQEPLVAANGLVPPTSLVTDPDTGQLMDTHPMFDSIAVDRNNGKLYAVWIDARFSSFQYNSIALSMSADGGFTWSTPIQVNQTPNTVPAIDRQAWNPAVAVAADGTVAVSYYDFRNNTPDPGALTDYWLAYCRPSASAPATNPANWSEVRLTNTSFNLEQAPSRTSVGFKSNFFLGDYEGLASAGNDFVAVWGMPNGTSTNQESIYFRRVFSGDNGVRSAAVASSFVPGNAAADVERPTHDQQGTRTLAVSQTGALNRGGHFTGDFGPAAEVVSLLTKKNDPPVAWAQVPTSESVLLSTRGVAMRTPQWTRLEIEQLEARDTPSSVVSVHGDLAGTFDFADGAASYIGQMSHLGAFGGGFQVVASGPGGALVTTGMFVAANGDTLTKSSTITLTATATHGIDTFIDAVMITGGTGRFAGDVGTMTITGQVNLSTGAFSGEITGTLTEPGW
jgi:hypothetical protein